MLREKVLAMQCWVDSLEKELSAREPARPLPSHHTADDLLGLGMSGSAEILDTFTGRIDSHDHHRTGLGHRSHSTLLPYFNGEDAVDKGAFN